MCAGAPRSAVPSEPYLYLSLNPGKLGVIRRIVSFFTGMTGAIDVGRVRVQWNDEAGHEIISRVVSPVIFCPNWTTRDKFNLLSRLTVEPDVPLEAGEQFEISLYLQTEFPLKGCSPLCPVLTGWQCRFQSTGESPSVSVRS
jgi:hypothetical protein